MAYGTRAVGVVFTIFLADCLEEGAVTDEGVRLLLTRVHLHIRATVENMGVAWCHPRTCSHITGGVRDNPHHRGGQRQPTPGDTQRPTQPEPEPSSHSNLNHIPTWQTLPGSQSEQRSLAERQGSLTEGSSPVGFACCAPSTASGSAPGAAPGSDPSLEEALPASAGAADRNTAARWALHT